MSIDQSRKAIQTRPFRALTIHVADGRSLEVPHEDFISQSPSGRTVIVYGEGDDFTIVDGLMITQIAVHATPEQMV